MCIFIYDTRSTCSMCFFCVVCFFGLSLSLFLHFLRRLRLFCTFFFFVLLPIILSLASFWRWSYFFLVLGILVGQREKQKSRKYIIQSLIFNQQLARCTLPFCFVFFLFQRKASMERNTVALVEPNVPRRFPNPSSAPSGFLEKCIEMLGILKKKMKFSKYRKFFDMFRLRVVEPTFISWRGKRMSLSISQPSRFTFDIPHGDRWRAPNFCLDFELKVDLGDDDVQDDAVGSAAATVERDATLDDGAGRRRRLVPRPGGRLHRRRRRQRCDVGVGVDQRSGVGVGRERGTQRRPGRLSNVPARIPSRSPRQMSSGVSCSSRKIRCVPAAIRCVDVVVRGGQTLFFFLT